MEPLEYYQSLASQLIEENGDRDRLYAAMDRMFHGEHVLPGQLEQLDWVWKMTSSEPHDAIETGARIYSGSLPKITYYPRNPVSENKTRANEIEMILKWWLKGATKRRKTRLINDVIKSCLLYDTVAVRVIHMGNQKKAMGELGKFMKYDGRYGPFAFDVHHPGNVYAMESVWGLEGVLLVKTEPLYKVRKFWGKAADKMMEKVEEGRSKKNPVDFTYVTTYDWIDSDVRVVWAHLGESTGRKEPSGDDTVEIIAPKEHGLPFIPWVYRTGASNLAPTSDKQLHPMLYSVYRTGSWETLNLLETVQMSEVIALANSPRWQVQGNNPDGVETDHNQPGGVQYVPPGMSAQPLPPLPLDEKLTIMSEQVRARMDGSTIARVLQGVTGGQEAFASLNLRTQSAVGQLTPHKVLAETGIADMCEQMLLWVKHEGNTEIAYSQERGSTGKQIAIEPDEIDPDHLYLEIELKDDVPTDRIARINGARLLVGMGYSKARALEETGVADPEQAITEGFREMMEQAVIEQQIQKYIQEEQAKQEIRIQQMVQQAMGPPPGQQQPQPPIGGVPGGGGMPMGPPNGGFPEGGPNFGPLPPGGPPGQGFNPAMGGTPPAELAPELTREGITGVDRTGREI